MKKAEKLRRKADKEFKEQHQLPPFERYIPTLDDWYPTYDNGTVRVKVNDVRWLWDELAIRVCAWGADDFGLELDLRFASHEEVEAAFAHWVETVKGWESVTQQQLKALGFVPA